MSKESYNSLNAGLELLGEQNMSIKSDLKDTRNEYDKKILDNQKNYHKQIADIDDVRNKRLHEAAIEHNESLLKFDSEYNRYSVLVMKISDLSRELWLLEAKFLTNDHDNTTKILDLQMKQQQAEAYISALEQENQRLRCKLAELSELSMQQLKGKK